MSTGLTRRRVLQVGAQAAAVAVAGKFLVTESAAQTAPNANKYKKAFRAVDDFAEQYMREMNSPGMSLVLANKDGVLRVATYGFSDLELRQRVQPQQLFHIGSITKSFTGIAVLQLHEEGKLDLQKPISDYLPWLKIESPYPMLTVHHLLTHSSGLPGNVPIWLSDPNARHKVGFETGKHFHYCNLGYDILGRLVSELDGRTYGESIRKRILEPLGMTATEPAITPDIRERTAKSYMVYQDERPYPRLGKLAEAPQLIFEKGSGSIASTPHDMGLYIHAIVNRGQGAKARILKPESFDLFVKPHVKADDFGPTASYGYGLAIDKMDDHSIARHTGGMVSFMSAMHIDLDEGVGAFASINAMQGYRPNPVAIYALKCMRAVNESKPMPEMPPKNPPTKIPDVRDYAGVFTAPDGRKLQFVTIGDNLFLLHKEQRVPVEASPSGLIARHPDFMRYVFVFNRGKENKGPAIEVAHGSDWYAGASYTGQREFTYPKEWDAYVGHYRNDSPWIGSFRVLKRQGKLWLEGTLPLEAKDANTFRLADSPHNPEWLQFLGFAGGKSHHVKLSGEDFWRVDAP
jgi:CubicO group peptidase (beta-lactamase class C family)